MKKDRNILVAMEMGALTAEMDRYHNAIDVYARYLEKLDDPNEDRELIAEIAECIKRYMDIRNIPYEDVLEERRILERFIKKRAAANGISERDYCKKFGLRAR